VLGDNPAGTVAAEMASFIISGSATDMIPEKKQDRFVIFGIPIFSAAQSGVSAKATEIEDFRITYANHRL